MPLPPLYKFLDRQGARLTLSNRTFRHAKPSSFNDLEDLTIQSIFSEETESALEKLSKGLLDVIQSNLHREPTCAPRTKGMIQAIQASLRSNPAAIEIIKAELSNSSVSDVEAMKSKSDAFVAEINEFMQGYRILCVTTAIGSERMWERYAENGQGVALRIEGNLEKDSKFKLFRPVTYADIRPPLYHDTLQFLEDSLFGDRQARCREILDRIIYTKTRDWEYEQEYRLSVPLREGEEPWEFLPYHSEEITELHIGPNMPGADKEEISQLGSNLNPDIRIFQIP
jgi:hypothetical protein